MSTSATFSLVVLSAERQLHTGQVRQLRLPTADGELTILPQHAALVANLHAGELVSVDEHGHEEHLFVGGGVLEIGADGTCRVLADIAERVDELDEQIADEARARAQRDLDTATSEPEVAAAQVALMHALARIELAERSRRKVGR